MINGKIIREKHVSIVVLIFAIFPLIPNSFKGVPVVLLLVAVIFSNINKQTNWKWLLINSSLFLLYLFSLLYTEDFRVAVRKLETGLSILIIPIIFYGFLFQYRFQHSLKIKFFKIFVFSTFCFSIICLLFTLFDDSTVYYSNWYTDKFRSLISNIPLIGQHPIYASIFLSLSVLFFLEIKKSYSYKEKEIIIYVGFILVNVLFLIILASKGVILSLLLVVFINLIKNKKKIKLIAITVIITISFLVFNRRAKELFKIETYNEINENFSTSIRVGIYECVFKVIKEEFFLGYGIGDSQQALNLCYANESNILLKNRYNSHNQFLDVFLKTGFLGFSIFLYFLFWNYNRGLKNKNRLLVTLLVFYCFIFLIENVLVRQSGVIFFFFLISFFSHSNSINENSRFK